MPDAILPWLLEQAPVTVVSLYVIKRLLDWVRDLTKANNALLAALAHVDDEDQG